MHALEQITTFPNHVVAHLFTHIPAYTCQTTTLETHNLLACIVVAYSMKYLLRERRFILEVDIWGARVVNAGSL
jgi:hypothetical protein